MILEQLLVLKLVSQPWGLFSLTLLKFICIWQLGQERFSSNSNQPGGQDETISN